MANDPIIRIPVEVGELKTALKDIGVSIDRLNKSIDNMGQKFTTKSRAASQGTKKQTQDMKLLNAEYRKLQKEFDQVTRKSKRFAQGSAEYKKSVDQLKKINNELFKLKSQGATGIDKVTQAQTRLNNRVSIGRQLFLRLKSVMLTVFGAYAVINGIKNTINTIKEFELGLARVQAITGATDDGMKRLAASARLLATRGIFNPTEITELQVKLAKFGFTLSEIESSTEGIIKLATATGEELAPAAELVSSVIRGLGLAASDTSHIVDVMGKAFTSSALDINKFRESAKYVVPLARQLGWSIEDLSATLGILSNSIISGSLAGTGLRTLFIEMSNSSSELSNLIGSGVKSFDDFVEALDSAKESGVSLDEILQAVPKRAVTLFTTLYSNIDALVEYREKLDDVNGAIDEMANIQLQTLAYQLEQTKNSWDAFILSLNESNAVGNVFSTVLRDIQFYLNAWNILMNKNAVVTDRAKNNVDDFVSSLGDVGVSLKRDKTAERIQELSDLIQDIATSGVESTLQLKLLREELYLLQEALKVFSTDTDIIEYRERFDELFESFKAAGVGEANALVKAYSTLATEIDKSISDINDTYEKKYSESTEVTRQLMDKKRKEDIKHWNDVLGSLNDYYAQLLGAMRKSSKDITKEEASLMGALLQRRMDYELSLASLIEDDLERELKIAEIKHKYAKEGYDLDIMLAENNAEMIQTIHNQMAADEKVFQQTIADIRQKFRDKDFKEALKNADDYIALQKAKNDREIASMKLNNAKKEEIWRRQLELDIQLLELEILIAQEAGEATLKIQTMNEELGKMQDELDAGFSDDSIKKIEKNVDKTLNAYERLANEIVDYLKDIANAHVENTSRIVDDLDTRIAETQRSLDQEIQLYTEGYANNVTAKRAEVAELKVARDKALRDREQAVKRQQTLDSISQAVNLATAISDVIKTYAGIPFAGLAIAAGVIAGMVALFSSMKAKTSSLTQYGEGGDIKGKSHAGGGVVIEAEGGEFVINKRAYSKYPDLVRAINEDDVPTINQSLLSSTTIEKRGGNTIVDNKIWNKMYDLWDKKLNKENIEVVGNKKIITKGIKKRIINV